MASSPEYSVAVKTAEVAHALAQEEFAIFGYAVRACERYNESRIRSSEYFKSRCAARTRRMEEIKELLKKGPKRSDLESLCQVARDDFPSCLSEERFSIECQRSERIQENVSRSTWVPSQKLFVINVRWEPGTLLNDPETLFRVRFLVAHELGHILLHSSGQRAFDSRRCRPEQEAEADAFAKTLVESDMNWVCQGSQHQLCQLTQEQRSAIIAEIMKKRDECCPRTP